MYNTPVPHTAGRDFFIFTMKPPFRERIKQGPILCDGAMGTLLDLYDFDEKPNEIHNLKHPDNLERHQREDFTDDLDCN